MTQNAESNYEDARNEILQILIDLREQAAKQANESPWWFRWAWRMRARKTDKIIRKFKTKTTL